MEALKRETIRGQWKRILYCWAIVHFMIGDLSRNQALHKYAL